MDLPLEFICRQSLLFATPLCIAGYGELISQRAGVINIGIEGLMLIGCIAAYGAAVITGSAAAAIPAAILITMLFALAFALVTLWFGADQIVAGTAMNILCLGASTTAWTVLSRHMALHKITPPPLYDPISIPGISRIPFVGPVLAQQYALFYVALVVGIVLHFVLRRTRLGLIVRSLGDSPEACDAAGIPVRGWRTAFVLLAGACAGIAGAYLSTMRGHSFNVNMTGGQGFLVLALVIFGRWHIAGLAAGTVLFGMIEGLQAWLAGIPGASQVAPHQLFDMLPYAATLIALALMSRSRAGPIYLGRPWP